MSESAKQIQVFAQEENPIREQVLLLPGYLFFTEMVEIPDGMQEDELEPLAELTLEGLTPFDLDQLHWGYAWDMGSGVLFVFAVYKERLRQEGYSNLDDYRQVYPDFLALDSSNQDHPQILIIEHPGSVTAAAFPKGSRIPVAISGLPLEEDEVPEIVLDEIINELDESQFDLGETIVAPIQSEVPYEGPIQFIHNQETKVILPDSLKWSADLRTTDFGKKMEGNRRRDKLLWKAMLVAAGITALLLVLEGLRIGGNIFLHFQEQTIEAQTPPVTQIQSRNTLVSRLEERATANLRPFQALRLLNQNRPPTIYFTSAEASIPNRVVIDGVARTANEVNSYTKLIEGSGYFESVRIRNQRSQSGQTTFTLDIIVGDLPAAGTEVSQVD